LMVKLEMIDVEVGTMMVKLEMIDGEVGDD
jgi:hypothetical protein